MKQIMRSGEVSVYAEPVVGAEGRGERRLAEQSAVSRMVADVFGPDVQIGHREDGSPFVMVGQAPEVSVSHCRTLAVLAVGGDERIGVDVEEWREQLRRVARKFLSADEAFEADDEALLRAWTVKEAVYKAAGCPGLALTDIRWHGSEALTPVGRFSLTFGGVFPLFVTLAQKMD